MSRTEAGAERASQAEDAQMPMWDDQGLRRVFPSLELTTATCGVEHQRRQMRLMMRLQARIRQVESEPRRQCFVEGVALAKELQAGGYPRVVVLSDGEPALLAHVRAARAMTMVSDVPLESVHEQVSKE